MSNEHRDPVSDAEWYAHHTPDEGIDWKKAFEDLAYLAELEYVGERDVETEGGLEAQPEHFMLDGNVLKESPDVYHVLRRALEEIQK